MSTKPRIVDRDNDRDNSEPLANIPNLELLPQPVAPEILPERKLVREEGYRAWRKTNLPEEKPKTR